MVLSSFPNTWGNLMKGQLLRYWYVKAGLHAGFSKRGFDFCVGTSYSLLDQKGRPDSITF